MNDDYILILGGLGFLGANVCEFHREMGDEVLVVCRKNSIYRRLFLYEQLKNKGVNFFIRDTLRPSLVLDILKTWGSPRIFYNVIGKLRGKIGDLMDSHVILPYSWSKKIIDWGEGTLIVYISHAFQSNCYKSLERGGIVLIEEEEEHLERCVPKSVYEKTKALGERLLLSLETKQCKIVVLRPGLLVGRYSYHPEWRILYKLAKRGIVIEGGIKIPVTPAGDVPRIARFLLDKEVNREWFIVTPYTVDIGDLLKIMIKALNSKVRVRLPLRDIFRVITKIGVVDILGPISTPLDEKSVYTIRKIRELGYDKWTPLSKAVKESVEWLRGVEI